MKGGPTQPPAQQPMQQAPSLSPRDELALNALHQVLLGAGQIQGMKIDTKEEEKKTKDAEKRFLMEQLSSQQPGSWQTTVVVGKKGST